MNVRHFHRPHTLAHSLVLLFSALLLIGCAEHERVSSLYTSLDNAEGLVPGSPVLWRGVQIGTVESLQLGDSGVSVAIDLSPEYRGQLREGARAKVMRGVMTRNQPALQIYGGTDTERAALPNGAVIPEATFLDTYPDHFLYKHRTWLIAGIAILVVCIFVLKGIMKLFFIGLALLACVVAFWILQQQWDRHKDVVLTPEIEARLDAMANETIRSPQVVEYWNSLRGDMSIILDQARERGNQAAAWTKERVSELISEKVDEARDKGEEAVAEELIRLKGRLESMLDGLENVRGTARDLEQDSPQE